MYIKNQRHYINVLQFIKSGIIGYQTMQTWPLSAKYLYCVEINAEGLTREILTDLINLSLQKWKSLICLSTLLTKKLS